MNGYIAFVEGVRHEIRAETLYAASVKARALYAGRKKHPTIWVELVELGCQQITTAVTA